jgi:hypothetical protein
MLSDKILHVVELVKTGVDFETFTGGGSKFIAISHFAACQKPQQKCIQQSVKLIFQSFVFLWEIQEIKTQRTNASMNYLPLITLN